MADSLPGMFYSCRNGRSRSMDYISSGCFKLTGYSDEEFTGNDNIGYNSIIHPEDRVLVNDYLFSRLLKNEVCNCEYRIINRDGRIRWVNEIANGVFNEYGDLQKIEGHISDITEKKEYKDYIESLETLIAEATASNEFYKNIINNANIEISILDPDNRYRLINKSAIENEELRELMIGRNDFDYCLEKGMSPVFAEARSRMYKLVDELQKPVEWMEELKDDKGDNHYYVRTLKPFTAGEMSYKMSYGVDVTALKFIQKELVRREHLLSFSHKLAKIGYWVWYKKTSAYEWSDCVYDILEVERKDIHPSLNTYYSFIHEDDREAVKQTIAGFYHAKRPFVTEYRIVTPTGKIKYIKEQSCMQAEDINSEEYDFGIVQDITETKRSQEALAKSEDHFRAIAESSPVFILEINTSYEVIYINRSRYLNISDILFKPVFNLVDEEYHDELKAKVDAAFGQAATDSIEVRSSAAFPESQWYNVSIGAVKDRVGGVRSVILLAHDNTEKRQIEEEKERLIREINHKYNELMQFNYIVSHNLRSPVANILGMTYLLTPDLSRDEARMFYDYIAQSAESIDTLIKDLNTVLSARSPLNEKREPFTLREIVEVVCNNLETQINESLAFICIDIDPDADKLNSIKSYVQSIIYNLLSNAIKYKAPERAPEISIKAKRREGTTHIEVSDNGMGINLGLYGDQIFGLYKRFTTRHEGKGLGLHMTKAQIESLGGTIHVESEEGKGTSFLITLAN